MEIGENEMETEEDEEAAEDEAESLRARYEDKVLSELASEISPDEEARRQENFCN